MLRQLCRKLGLFGWLWLVMVSTALFAPAVASAATAHPTTVNLLSNSQLWVMIFGALTPLATYMLNHFAPWVSEPVKGIVLAVVAAAVGALVTAVHTGVFGWNQTTLQMLVTAVVAAFSAHLLIWKPTAIAAALGGGSNKQTAATAPVE